MRKWWRRSQDLGQDHWLAAKLLDEALRVFGVLQAAVYLDDPRLDHELRKRFRVTSLEVLDDVACLASLAGAAPTWPPLPRAAAPAADRGEPPSWIAVEALGDYTQRLAAVAVVFAHREDEAATAFARLAAAAEARIEVLAS
jgi:hypothetical protein